MAGQWKQAAQLASAEARAIFGAPPAGETQALDMVGGLCYTHAAMFLFDLQLFASKKGAGSTRN